MGERCKLYDAASGKAQKLGRYHKGTICDQCRAAGYHPEDVPVKPNPRLESDELDTCTACNEIARAGARKMLAEALEAEVEDYLQAAKGERDDHGHSLVVRNGYAREREVLLGAGSVEVRAPRVNDKRVQEDGQRRRFKSMILPPYMRRSPKVKEVLPLLYLHGLSSGDFVPALQGFFGSEAGLSTAAITRLSEHWQQEHEHFMSRDLSERDYVYLWVEGIHTNVRLGSDARLCCLVVLGARLDGTKELVALADGYRESEESWAELLRNLKKRGMRASELALGFWSALRDVIPEARCQRDWVHKTMNSLDAMPKSVHALGPRRPSKRSPRPRTREGPAKPSRTSHGSSEPSGQRPSQGSSRTRTLCSPFTTFQPSIGATCAPPTP
jgi:transposase-like protein